MRRSHCAIAALMLALAACSPDATPVLEAAPATPAEIPAAPTPPILKCTDTRPPTNETVTCKFVGDGLEWRVVVKYEAKVGELDAASWVQFKSKINEGAIEVGPNLQNANAAAGDTVAQSETLITKRTWLKGINYEVTTEGSEHNNTTLSGLRLELDAGQ